MLWKRMMSQSLAGSGHDDPADVVEWMGAVQAQEYRMMKWSVGIRMRTPSLAAVGEALDSGRILRTHIMRPTWHLIPARDIKWMAALSEKPIKSAWTGYARKTGITADDYYRSRYTLQSVLEGRHLTREEVRFELAHKINGIDERHIRFFLDLGEAEGIICSGADKDGKNTYALTVERVADPVELSTEEALAELARRYFRSHGPASLEDFIWWSGLGVRDCRSAIASLGQEIITVQHGGRELIIHSSSPALAGTQDPDQPVVRFLPPFDEYLISYKHRFDCIKESHAPLAYNNFGTFQPVILHNGRITGNWRKTGKKVPIETTFFPGCRPAAQKLLHRAAEEYLAFLDS